MLVQYLAENLVKKGFAVGVVCRSYGGLAGPHELTGGNLDPYVIGDEAALLYCLLGLGEGTERIWISSGEDKTAAAKLMLRRRPEVDVILIDDAFQHHRIRRDLDLLIWPKNGVPLRDYRSAQRGADILLVPNGMRSPREESETVYFVKETGEIHAGVKPTTATGPGVSRRGAISLTPDQKILWVAGLGPETDFFDQCRKIRPASETPAPWAPEALIRPQGTSDRYLRLPDHVDYHNRAVQSKLLAEADGCDALVTTAKDAVKLIPLALALPPIYVVPVRIKILSNESLLWKKIEECLND